MALVAQKSDRISLDDAAQALRPGIILDGQTRTSFCHDLADSLSRARSPAFVSWRAAFLPPGRKIIPAPLDQRRADNEPEDGPAMIAAACCLPLVLGQARPEFRAGASFKRVGPTLTIRGPLPVLVQFSPDSRKNRRLKCRK
ncbi:MAG: hypothetical protein WCA20_11660 [Candidatus Sulfotelmatobacter sp.]